MWHGILDSTLYQVCQLLVAGLGVNVTCTSVYSLKRERKTDNLDISDKIVTIRVKKIYQTVIE